MPDRAGRAHRLKPLPQSGLAHVAAVSFLAARAAPSAGFWITLAGGVALARAGERLGPRRGYGASLAAMLQSITMMGPARLGVPLTQAASAPLIGRLAARGAGFVGQFLACAVIRVLHNAATTAFFIWVIVGGLDAYAGSYDAVFARLPLLPHGAGAALALTAAGIVAWTAFASTVQVLVYRRGLRRWPEVPPPLGAPAGAGEGAAAGRAEAASQPPRRFEPRAVALAAAIAFALLVASTSTPVLIAVAVWLTAATAAAGKLDRDALPAGLALAAILALSGFGFTLLGGLGLELALRRGARAGLLVLVATWLRAAAGSAGLREVSRRALARLSAIPALSEASRVFEELGSAPRLLAAGRSLFAALASVRRRPLPIVDAVLGWVESESGRFEAAAPVAAPRMTIRARDAALVTLAAAPIGVLLAAGW